jgi:hypothetical protein
MQILSRPVEFGLLWIHFDNFEFFLTYNKNNKKNQLKATEDVEIRIKTPIHFLFNSTLKN